MSDAPTGAEGYVRDGFPAPGLRRTTRLITGFDGEGKSIFLSTDSGAHFRVMGEQQAVANILYSSQTTPIEVNDNADVKLAAENEPPLHYPNGSVFRMIDFGPGIESPLHRAVSVDYGVVIEGMFELSLDSGETRVMREGDVCINRAGSHKWKNITGDGKLPGRMLWVLLPCTEPVINGKKIEGFLGALEKEYTDRSGAEETKSSS